MVDHRAEAPSALRLGGSRRPGGPGGDAWRAGAVARAGEVLKGLFSSDPEGSGRLYRLPILVTGVWLMALGAYAIGYFDRLGDGLATGTVRALPTLDLLFFAFAAIGPVLMLWMVVLLQARSARLSDAMNAQSESALALAATVASLHEAVETLSAGTRGKIADAAAVLERDGAAAMARLDASLAEQAEKLDTGLTEATLMLDSNLRQRTQRADAALDAQREALARRLEADAEKLSRSIEAQARGLEAAQQVLGERIADSLEAQARSLDAAQQMLGERIAASLDAHGNRFESGTAELLAGLGTQMADIGDRVDAALNTLAADLASAQRNRHRELDADMRQRETRMHAAVQELARTIEDEVAPLLGELRSALAETGRTVAANPPASAETLARLLGEAAMREIAPDRAALSTAVSRMTALEEQAARLLERIDRTARLNPLMDGSSDPAQPPAGGLPELPFAALPRGAGRAVLNWTAVVHALDGRPVGEASRRTVDAASADPDVAAVATLAAGVAGALAEDGLHVADIAPVHAPAALWHRFARGDRGGELAALAGIEDEIALAIARARLRDDPAFRALAMRLVAAYMRLLARAAAEIGADPRMVELAETPPGRAFVLVATLTRAFQPVPVAAE